MVKEKKVRFFECTTRETHNRAVRYVKFTVALMYYTYLPHGIPQSLVTIPISDIRGYGLCINNHRTNAFRTKKNAKDQQ